MKKKSLIIGVFLIVLFFIFLSSSVVFSQVCPWCCDNVCPGGLVPCGRNCIDNTAPYNTTDECTICHFFLMIKNILDFVLKLAVIVAILFIVFGGLMYIFSTGNEAMLTKAKSMIFWALGGFTLCFISWLTVTAVMSIFGYTGDKWYEVNCGGSTMSAFTCCGDNQVNQPNSFGFNEECEKNEPLANFLARGTDDLDKDGDVDNIDYMIMQLSCQENCVLGCVGDPNIATIGEGCYLPGVFCQKGKYVCDTDPASPTFDTVICKDIYPTPLYDYCCRATDDPSYSLTDAQADLNAIAWKRVKPPAAYDGSCGTYNCDDVCRNIGKICIGTSITDDVTTACYGVKCHTGNDCTLDANLERIDCRIDFPFFCPTAGPNWGCKYTGVVTPWNPGGLIGCNTFKCTNPETYYTCYASCLCK